MSHGPASFEGSFEVMRRGDGAEDKAMRPTNIYGGLALAVALSSCGGGGPSNAEDAATSPDAFAVDAPRAAPLCANVPTSNFGSSRGRKLEDFTLPRCDGTPYQFYGEEFCAPTHRLTVVSIAAEWCAPCQVESAMLTDLIVRPYAPRGVRVIQILIQNASYGPPDAALCERWVRRYNLTENIELMDPTGITSGAFPSGSLPSTLIVDETGTIIYREDGASDMLVTLRAELERALSR